MTAESVTEQDSSSDGGISEETWTAVRSAYLSGVTAPQVSKTFGVSKSSMYRRARRDGWRRKDVKGGSPPNEDPATLAWNAMRRAAEKAARGRPEDAEPYARLAERLARTARALAGLTPSAGDERGEDDEPVDFAAELEARLDHLLAISENGGEEP